MPSNRREFLRKSGALCASLACLPALAWESEAAPAAAVPQDQGLERWLLGTGRDKIDPSIFANISSKLG
ncbi:MAG TPA: twin-arginine translocation signal domain-containing protein [Thermoanaerobaculia bacterium]